MKKFINIAFTFLLIAICNSCTTESLDGKWNSMEWQKVIYEKKQINGVSYYIFPTEGGTCQFKCKNYKFFWISHVSLNDSPFSANQSGSIVYPEREDGSTNDIFNITAEGVKVHIEGNTMYVQFEANAHQARYIQVVVTAGDIFKTFYFAQDSTASE